MDIPAVQGAVMIQMPAWNATYQIRDFSSRIRNLRATGKDGKKLQIERFDKQTWRIFGDESVEVEYEIYWDEPGPFGSQLNASHAFMNLAEILFYVPGRRQEGCDL